MTTSPLFASPRRAFVVVMVGAFLSEALLTVLLPYLGLESEWVAGFLDSLLLTLVVGTLGYGLMIRPQIAAARPGEERLRAAEQEQRMAAALFETSAEAMVVCDADNSIIKVNPAFTELSGYAGDEVVGQNPRILSSGYHDAAFYAVLWRDLERDGRWCGDIWNRRKDGQIYAQRASISVIRDAQGARTNYVAVFSDIIDERREADRIMHQAKFDALTGLPNRSLLWERLAMAFPPADHDRLALSLLFIDLDDFKSINDAHGHLIGDELLKMVAKRLKRCVRQTDTVARLGGDEFVILSLDINSRRTAAMIANKVLGALCEPMKIDDLDLTIGVSIGVAVFPDDGRDPETLLYAADAAMDEAKRMGKGIVRFNSEQPS